MTRLTGLESMMRAEVIQDTVATFQRAGLICANSNDPFAYRFVVEERIKLNDAVNIGEKSCDGVFSELRVYALRRICLLRNSPASSFVLVSLPVTLDSLKNSQAANVS